MPEFTQISPLDLNDNPFKLMDPDWFLLTAGTMAKWNTMTAGWGALGINWGRKVIITFVRHSRYTFEFMEEHDLFACSWFDEEYRDALNLCGSRSGRDTDKAAETGLKPMEVEGSVGFEQARLQMVCRKIYADDISSEYFIDRGLNANYPDGDFHRFYFGEILTVQRRAD